MKIVCYPHPILAYPSKPLTKIDQPLREIVAEMFDLMYAANGVGLAANQVALPYQLLVMNPAGTSERKEEECVLINPVITKRSRELREIEEGCLSFPELHLNIVRPAEVKLQAIDLSGRLCYYEWKGMKARIAQHEIDHLNGHCFYERANYSDDPKAQRALAGMTEVFRQAQAAGEIERDEQLKRQIAERESERTAG